MYCERESHTRFITLNYTRKSQTQLVSILHESLRFPCKMMRKIDNAPGIISALPASVTLQVKRPRQRTNRGLTPPYNSHSGNVSPSYCQTFATHNQSWKLSVYARAFLHQFKPPFSRGSVSWLYVKWNKFHLQQDKCIML